MKNIREVCLPEELCHAAEVKFSQRFGNIEELLGTVLKELLREDALVMDESEQQIIEDRLRGLGYI